MNVKTLIIKKKLLDLKQSKHKYTDITIENSYSQTSGDLTLKVYNKNELILNIFRNSNDNKISIKRIWLQSIKTKEEINLLEELEKELNEFIKENKLDDSIFKTIISSKNHKHYFVCTTNYFDNLSDKKLKLLKSKLENLTEQDIEFIYIEIVSGLFKGKEVFINNYKKDGIVEILVSKTKIYII